MTQSHHTPGLLEHDMRGYPHPDVRAVSGTKVAVTWGVGPQAKNKAAYEARTALSRANARRIVACWNACDGIDTDMLEGFSPRFLATYPDRVLAERRALEAQRDALLASITRLANAAFARDTTMGDQCGLFAAQAELRDATKIAREAIALATKPAGVPT